MELSVQTMARLREMVKQLKEEADEAYKGQPEALKIGGLHQLVSEIVGREMERIVPDNDVLSEVERTDIRREIGRVLHYLVERVREEQGR